MGKGTKLAIKLVICILVIALIAGGIYFVGIKDKQTETNNNDVVTNTVLDNTDTTEEEETVKKLKLSTTTTTELLKDTVNDKNVAFNIANLDGDIAYSLDYGASMPSKDMSFKSYASDQLMAIIISGYSNVKPEELGCENADEAYVATQMAIWEIANRTKESKKATETFRVEETTALAEDTASYDRIVAAAKKLVKLAEEDPYTIVPSMVINNSNTEYKNIEGNNLIGPYIVNVSNVKNIKSIKASLINAPQGTKITDVNGKEKTIFENGDSVYVKMGVTEKGTTSFDIKFESFVDRICGTIYEEKGKDSQDFVKLEPTSNAMEKTLTINFETITTIGKIEVIATDKEDKPMVGAKFQLIDSSENVLGETKTGTDGKIMFYSVPQGDYTLKQITAPEGYEIKEETKKVTVVGGETATVTFEN